MSSKVPSMLERFKKLTRLFLLIFVVITLAFVGYAAWSKRSGVLDQVDANHVVLKSARMDRYRSDLSVMETVRDLADRTTPDMAEKFLSSYYRSTGNACAVLDREGFVKIASDGIGDREINIFDAPVTKKITVKPAVKNISGDARVPVFMPLPSGMGYLYVLWNPAVPPDAAVSEAPGMNWISSMLVSSNGIVLEGREFSAGQTVSWNFEDGKKIGGKEFIFIPARMNAMGSELPLWYVTVVKSSSLNRTIGMEILFILLVFPTIVLVFYIPVMIVKYKIISDLSFVIHMIRTYYHKERIDLREVPKNQSMEIRQLAKLFATLTEKINRDVKTIEAKASVDTLTKLLNRANMDKEIHARADNNEIFSLLFMDLDGFKKVNDELGHDAGDAVLKEVGRSLQDTFRGDDICSRWGGDEFLVLLNGDVENVIGSLIKRVREKLDRIDPALMVANTEKKGQYKIGVSVGFVSFPGDASRVDELINLADERMYTDKQMRKELAAKNREMP